MAGPRHRSGLGPGGGTAPPGPPVRRPSLDQLHPLYRARATPLADFGARTRSGTGLKVTSASRARHVGVTRLCDPFVVSPGAASDLRCSSVFSVFAGQALTYQAVQPSSPRRL